MKFEVVGKYLTDFNNMPSDGKLVKKRYLSSSFFLTVAGTDKIIHAHTTARDQVSFKLTWTA